MSLDCEEHAFEVRTEKQWLGKMTYPSSWKAVYAAAAGQSSDHVYKIGHFRKHKGVHGCGMHDAAGWQSLCDGDADVDGRCQCHAAYAVRETDLSCALWQLVMLWRSR